MTIELPAELESAIRARASAEGLRVEEFVRRVVERQLDSEAAKSGNAPFKTGRGAFAGYGQAPSAEEIDANRSEIFGSFGETLPRPFSDRGDCRHPRTNLAPVR